MTSLNSPSLNLDQNKPRSKFQEKGAKRYKCSCLSNCEVKRLLSIKMLSSTLRKGERKSVDKLARVSVNSNRTSFSQQHPRKSFHKQRPCSAGSSRARPWPASRASRSRRRSPSCTTSSSTGRRRGTRSAGPIGSKSKSVLQSTIVSTGLGKLVKVIGITTQVT